MSGALRRRAIVVIILACTSLAPVPALRLPQREESDGASESDRQGQFQRHDRVGLRSKLALPDVASLRVAGHEGKVGQVQSPFGLRPDGLSLLSDSAAKDLRMDAADGDRKPSIILREDEEPEEEPELGEKLDDVMPVAAAEAGTAALAAWGDAVGAWTGGGQGVWNAMLANAQVGMMAQGRLMVEPTLKTASSEVVRAALRGDVDGLRSALGDGHGVLEARTSPAGETPLMLATISANPDAVSTTPPLFSCIRSPSAQTVHSISKCNSPQTLHSMGRWGCC